MNAGYTDHGYGASNGTSYWGQDPGHNCTNYVAYVETQNGVAKPSFFLGDAYQWWSEAGGHVPESTTTPVVGSVAWWGANQGGVGSDGHVAYVEAVSGGPGSYTITVSEDSFPSGPFDWRKISSSDSTWPGGFIYFDDIAPPSAPVNVTAAGRYDSILVSWSPPGGAPVSSYTATANPGSASCSTSGTSCAITGLTDDNAYSVTVTAANGAGSSPPSAPVTAVPVDANPDYLGNGYSDLAWLTAGRGSNTLWLFDGANGFGTDGGTTGYGVPEPGVTGDFTGNGHSEIAWFQPSSPGASTGSIYLVSWNGSAWVTSLARGPGVGTPIFAATTSSSYNAPSLTGPPTVGLAPGGKLSKTTTTSPVGVTVSWTVTRGSGPVCAQSIQKSVNGGSTWTTLPAPPAKATSIRTTLTPAKATTFRVQEAGCNAVPSDWTASAPVTATITQETSATISYSTGWSHQACTACSGGGLEQTSAKDATATISLTGIQATALVLADGPSGGKATVATDGGAASTVNTYAPAAKNLTYGYEANWATDGNHTMVLTNLATAAHPDLQLDAIITLR